MVKIQRIEDLVGADNVSTLDETLGLYSRDIAALPGLAFQIIDNQFDVVAQPQTVRSLSNLIRYAHEHNIPIVPRGSGTSGWGGALPTRVGICISTLHLSNLVHIDENKMLVTVEAGMTWKELLMVLEQIGFTLPVYPSSAAAATIGGFVASGGLGIGSAKYGDIREQVAGLEAVLPNGMIVRTGNFLIKEDDNETEDGESAGAYLLSILDQIPEECRPEPIDLFLGLYGTFGVVSRVTLRMVPKLILQPFACVFDNVNDLTSAIRDIQDMARPYYLRFISNSYTIKRFTPRSSIDEYGKFILIGALLDTYFQIEEDEQAIKDIVKAHNGWTTQQKRAEYLWDERLYPLRIKTLGPSLVPAELLIDVEHIPELYENVLSHISTDSIAIEGTVGRNGTTSFLAWILDDERKKFRYTLGWHRSFDITNLGIKHGGKPYAVGLWNVIHAPHYYGRQHYNALRRIKRLLDPKDLLNPMKVFGGRVNAKKESLVFGFTSGLIVGALVHYALSSTLGTGYLWSILGLPHLGFQLGLFVAIIGGLVGLMFIKFLTIKNALRLGIPILHVLRTFLRK